MAHEHGLGEHYAPGARAPSTGWWRDLLGVLPPGAVLVVTSDHGQVEVGTAARLPGPELCSTMVELLSGEGRFRWLHVRPGALDDVVAVAAEAHGDEAWVRTREQMVDEGGSAARSRAEVARRLGDVALVARAPVAFLDPADTGETRLMARHGSLTRGRDVRAPVGLVPRAEPARRPPGIARPLADGSATRHRGGSAHGRPDTGDRAPARRCCSSPASGLRSRPRPGPRVHGAGATPEDDGHRVGASSRPRSCASGRWSSSCSTRCAAASLDEASRTRLREIYEQSVRELAGALSPDLAAELDRMALPFDESVPSEAELRIAQAQLVGWLEGLFHGIQATLLAQQMAARAQLEEMRQRGPAARPGRRAPTARPGHRPGTYLVTGLLSSPNDNAVILHRAVDDSRCGLSAVVLSRAAPAADATPPRRTGLMAATGSFAHLHTHTEYSMLDGAVPARRPRRRRPWPTASPRSGSPTTATCTGSSTSTPRAATPGINPVIGTEAYMAGESRHERPVRRGKVDDTGGDVEGGEKLYYHLTLLAETHAGLPQPHEAVLGRLPRGLLLQAPRRLGAARAPPRGHHRHHRAASAAWCSRRCWPTTRNAPSSWPVACRTSSGATASSSSSRTTAWPPSSRDQPGAGPHRPAARRARCSPPTTATTPIARTPWPTTPCCACRPARSSTTPSASSSRARSTT